ncbi:prepro-urotensin II-beta [Denticeps clupeoides]|uniref:prepro-urotensin II-beta n=1 Tax=Denticeps clupeoides TaxID=299321 RepID=UPI0010A51A52|nr:prepro-urotensin II-beta-like [Denticeps clupeoides]
MLCKLVLFCTLLFATMGPLLAHPVTHSSEMTYAGPVLVEEDQVVSPDELVLSDHAYMSRLDTGFGYPSVLSREINRDDIRTAGIVPGQAVKEVLLEKPLLNPLSRFLGRRKPYQKRGGNTECFWKYCV